jgi:hypothetical protein
MIRMDDSSLKWISSCMTLLLAGLLTDVLQHSELDKSFDTRVTLAVRHRSAHRLLECCFLLCLMDNFCIFWCWYRKSQCSIPHADHCVRAVHLYRCLLILSMVDTRNADEDGNGVDGLF